MTFLVAYAVFEAPSNILLKKTSPSAWIGFLMLGWGTMTIAMGASRNFATIATLRFFLGVFEAGTCNRHGLVDDRLDFFKTLTQMQVSSQVSYSMSRFGTREKNDRHESQYSLRLLHWLVLSAEHLRMELDT